ncbi:hypothetical protein SDC9_210836 [bioreactor metagenome]|uniref:Uncharacterized protein n=1 Tax=bioreactor metagenome TaxID=1076179 RepID=A0A645JIN2_9ZZZZ
MQAGSVHGIHDVVQCIAVVAAPLGIAQEVRVLGRAQLLGQAELGSLVHMLVAVVEKDCAMHLAHMEGQRGARAFELAAGAAGHLGHRAVAAHFHAVVGAG